MKLFNLSNFVGGWFVGNFLPTTLATKSVEVAIKRYNKGDTESSHYHLLADEITVIVEGSVKMNGVVYNKNDILHIEKSESTDFLALEDCVTCVVKMPSIIGDKYLCK